MEDRQNLINSLEAFAAESASAALKHAARAFAHKLRFPMRDILAKVPGVSLSERARKIGVSRQTLYVWMDERFRPTAPQAKTIAKLTGVPVEQIVDDGFEGGHDTRRKAAAKTAKLARRSGKTRKRDSAVPAKRRAKATAGSRKRKAR